MANSKFLIRDGGNNTYIVSGLVKFDSDVNITDDEMWVGDFKLDNTVKFKNSNRTITTPTDFLLGGGSSVSDWDIKGANKIPSLNINYITKVFFQKKLERYYELALKDDLTEIELKEKAGIDRIMEDNLIGTPTYDKRYLAYLRFINSKGLNVVEDVYEYEEWSDEDMAELEILLEQ